MVANQKAVAVELGTELDGGTKGYGIMVAGSKTNAVMFGVGVVMIGIGVARLIEMGVLLTATFIDKKLEERKAKKEAQAVQPTV